MVLMFGGQQKEQDRFAKKNNTNRQQTMKLAVTQTLSVSSIQVIASVALAVVLYIASTPGMLAELTAGTFVTIVFYMVMLLKPNDVTFTYPGKHNPAINSMNLVAPAGTSIALVGRSGSGKSTMSNLLTRFYLPEHGHITLDNTDINEFKLTELRKNIALVSQQVTLFNDTIANNIAYGVAENVSREAIEKAAKLAHVM